MSEMNSTKKCRKCKNIKPLSEFYKHETSADGLRYDCKECFNKRTAIYQKTDAGKLVGAKSKAKYLNTQKGKLSHIKDSAKYYATNPIKRKAQSAINNAIQLGKLTKPSTCEECARTDKIHGHHDDYSLPMVVRWLCQLCHVAWHHENGPGLNG